MKYKNSTNQTINFKENDNWHTIHPGEQVEVPEMIWKPAGLITQLDNVAKKEVDKKVDPVKEEIDLNKMTKDELNDYAAENGIKKEINSSMKKKSIIETLKKLLCL